MKALKFLAVCGAVLIISNICAAATQSRVQRPAAAPNQVQKPVVPRQSPDIEAEWWGPNPGRDQRPIAQGEVKYVDSTRIDIQTRLGLKQFAVNEQTRVVVRGQRASIGDVAPGDIAVVKFQPTANGIPLALGILVPKPRIQGTIGAVEGNVLVVAGPQGRVRVTLTDETRIMSRGYVGSIADLRVGYRVIVGGEPSAAVFVEFIPNVAKGAVTAIDGNIITIKLVRQNVLEFQASAATVVTLRPRVGPNVRGTLADVKVGSPVDVGFHGVRGEASPLLWIDVFTGM